MHACCGRNHLAVFNILTSRGADARLLIHAKDDNADDAYMIIGKYLDRKMSSSKDLLQPIKGAFMAHRGGSSHS